MPPKGVFKKKSAKTKEVNSLKNEQGIVLKKGDVVRLTKKAFQVHDPLPPTQLGQRVTQGKIVALFPDIPGLVQVEPKLGGFWTWSVNDLEKVS